MLQWCLSHARTRAGESACQTAHLCTAKFTRHNDAASSILFKRTLVLFFMSFKFFLYRTIFCFFKINRETCGHFTMEAQKEKGTGFWSTRPSPAICSCLLHSKMQCSDTILWRVCCIDVGMQFPIEFLTLLNYNTGDDSLIPLHRSLCLMLNICVYLSMYKHKLCLNKLTYARNQC